MWVQDLIYICMCMWVPVLFTIFYLLFLSLFLHFLLTFTLLSYKTCVICCMHTIVSYNIKCKVMSQGPIPDIAKLLLG